VLVGEYMGWNFGVGKGGAYAALIACWFAGLLYTCVAMIDSEVTSTVAAAGGQYTQAKHIVGPLMAFNVGLYLVFAYTMLEAANAITHRLSRRDSGRMAGHEGGIDQRPVHHPVHHVPGVAQLSGRAGDADLQPRDYRHRLYCAIIMLFFCCTVERFDSPLKHADLMAGDAALPYGWIGVLAAMHFGLWYYLGIEGTTQAAEEVRSPARALPFGTMAGIITLLIAATLTWYVCAGLMPWEYLGQAGVAPLFDAARLTGPRS
jgi:ethanolamine permease